MFHFFPWHIFGNFLTGKKERKKMKLSELAVYISTYIYYNVLYNKKKKKKTYDLYIRKEFRFQLQ